MFRTSSVHHQERFVLAVFADYGMWYYCAYYSTRPAVTNSLRPHCLSCWTIYILATGCKIIVEVYRIDMLFTCVYVFVSPTFTIWTVTTNTAMNCMPLKATSNISVCASIFPFVYTTDIIKMEGACYKVTSTKFLPRTQQSSNYIFHPVIFTFKHKAIHFS